MTMKKLAAWILAALMMMTILPAFATEAAEEAAEEATEEKAETEKEAE